MSESEFINKIKQIKSIQSIETHYNVNEPKPHIKVIVSKQELKEVDIRFIYKLLQEQDFYTWTFVIAP